MIESIRYFVPFNERLKLKLQSMCSIFIKIIGIFNNINESIDFISKHSPDIIFIPLSDFSALKNIINSSYHPSIVLLVCVQFLKLFFVNFYY